MTTRIYQLFLISITLFLTSCASSVPSINLLDTLGDYDRKHETNTALKDLSAPKFGPKRTKTKIAEILVHPHEMPTGDYFLGGWIKVIVQEPIWQK